MNWYSGDIAQAVAESRQKNAIFVVYVAGKGPDTERLTELLNEEKIRSQLESDSFVSIRIESDSQSYMQFASIYQVVPVPSIFFIGMSGVPIEIGTSTLGSVEELDEKIKSALSSSSSSNSASSSLKAAQKNKEEESPQSAKVENQPFDIKGIEPEMTKPNSCAEREIAGASSMTESTETNVQHEIVCEDGVCYKKPIDVSLPKEISDHIDQAKKEDNETAEVSTDLNVRIETTRKLLEQKRRERIEEEKLLEKEREIRRRREGREMQHLQEWKREQEIKELKENIRRERLEEQAARERIRAQIAADRAERAQKFAAPTSEVAASTTAKAQSLRLPSQDPNAKSDFVRLQFRLPNSDVHTNTFKPDVSILYIRDYVSRTLLANSGVNEFMLATAYPKYEFTSDDDVKSLSDMGLFPSAVILVIIKPSSKPTAIIARSGGIINIMITLFWTVLSPVFSILNYMRSVVTGRNAAPADGAQKRAHEDTQINNEASKRRNLDRFMAGPSTSKESDNFASNDDRNEQVHNQKPYRRYGASNVHRLTDKRKDSDDENATWNGNSTQQQ